MPALFCRDASAAKESVPSLNPRAITRPLGPALLPGPRWETRSRYCPRRQAQRRSIDRATIGVLPIRQDVFLDHAFPNKLPEFIISGKTVLVSRLRAIGQYFSDGALAYAEPNSPSALSEQMLRLYRDPELCDRLRQQARREYAPIRWEIMKARYLTVVQQLSGAVTEAARAQRTA